MRPRLRSVVEWIVVVAIALIVATATRAYAVQSFYIPSPSMSPTLMPGDRVVVDKLAGPIHRGDIVVFHRVAADPAGPPTLVKRVIGLPGETISGTGPLVAVDGKLLRQPWLPKLYGYCANSNAEITRVTVPPGHYFVMGDCRGDSDDSRFWGTVPASNVVGKVEVIVWRGGKPAFHWF